MWLRQYSHSPHSRQQRTLHSILPIIIYADCIDSGLIHHHQSATNKVNVHHRQLQLQLPTPPFTSSLNLFKRSNNCKLQLLIMASESGLHLGVYVNVYVLKTQIKHHFALSLNRYIGFNQLLPVTSNSLKFKRLSCKLLSPSLHLGECICSF
jgi:hypothetical protein